MGQLPFLPPRPSPSPTSAGVCGPLPGTGPFANGLLMPLLWPEMCSTARLPGRPAGGTIAWPPYFDPTSPMARNGHGPRGREGVSWVCAWVLGFSGAPGCLTWPNTHLVGPPLIPAGSVSQGLAMAMRWELEPSRETWPSQVRAPQGPAGVWECGRRWQETTLWETGAPWGLPLA